jgi:hypothetical protein
MSKVKIMYTISERVWETQVGKKSKNHVEETTRSKEVDNFEKIITPRIKPQWSQKIYRKTYDNMNISILS